MSRAARPRVRDPWPNRHTEPCTGCGARRHEIHDIDCRGHLGTGIRNHDGARRYLRRKFRQQPLAAPRLCWPGHRWYVIAANGPRTRALLGPYVSEMTAMANLPRGRRLACEADDRANFYGYGTYSAPYTAPTLFGR